MKIEVSSGNSQLRVITENLDDHYTIGRIATRLDLEVFSCTPQGQTEKQRTIEIPFRVAVEALAKGK